MDEINEEDEIEYTIVQSGFLTSSINSAINSFEKNLPIRAGLYLKKKNDPKVNEGLRVMEAKGMCISELAQGIMNRREYIHRSIIKILRDEKQDFYQMWPNCAEKRDYHFIWNFVAGKFRGQSNPYVAPLETELRCLASNASKK